MNKKVMLITFQNAYNYGAILQCFALQKELTILDYDVEVLNYLNHVIGNQYQPIYFGGIKTLCGSLAQYSKRKKRANNFKNFIAKNINLTKGYTKQAIKKVNWQEYVLITGSDQVWNPNITMGMDDIYTLNFGKGIKKISYAASIGNVENIEKNLEEYKQIISRMDEISVREEEAKERLTKISSKEINTVLDPTLLLTRQEWEKQIKGLPQNKQKYICAYVVKANDEYIKIVNDLSKKTGLPVVHFGVKNPGYKNVLESAYIEGPLEFINYIKNAEYVVTTSFHATVFSILFHKSFFVVPHQETGTRVTNLLDKIGVKDRVFYTYQQFQDIDYQRTIEWTSVEENLAKERKKSVEWLKETIEK